MTVNDYLRIRRNLKALRKISRYTQDELCGKIGLSRSSYSQLERGLRDPDLDTLYTLCQVYHITLDFLIHCDIQSVLGEYFLCNVDPLEGRRLLNIYAHLSYDGKGKLMERAEELYEMDTDRKR